jgi:hypothetical protein
MALLCNGKVVGDLAEIAVLRKEVARTGCDAICIGKRQLCPHAGRNEVRLRYRVPARVALQMAIRRAGDIHSRFPAELNRPTDALKIWSAHFVTAIETRFKASDRTYDACRIWCDVLGDGLARGYFRFNPIDEDHRYAGVTASPQKRQSAKPNQIVKNFAEMGFDLLA